MPRTTRPIFPRLQQIVESLGQRMALARLRRGISQTEMAERTGVTRTTIASLEAGKPSVSLAILVRVLGVLGMESDLDLIAASDEVGQRLADLRSVPRRRRRSPA